MSTAFTHFCGPEDDHSRNGICSNCGKCCVDTLPLTPLDIQRIKSYVRKHSIKPIAHPLNFRWTPPRDNICPFFNPCMLNGHHYIIYEVHPIICKHYQCHSYNDPVLYNATCQAMLSEAKEQPAVRKNISIFMTPRSLRYAIWPEKFPEYKHTQIILQQP